MDNDKKVNKQIKYENKAMREASGKVDSDSDLVCFFYLLMRDYLYPGAIENIMSQKMDRSENHTYQFTNGWLAKYAENIVNRLLENE